MSHEHPHHDHGHGGEPHVHAPEAQDAGSQALSEALHSSFAIVKIVMVLMVIAFFCSGFFQVGPSQKAIILRFGKPVGEGSKALLASGLHWSFPYPIDEVVKIPITEIQKVSSSVGWYFTTPEQELSGEELPAGPSLNPAIDSYVLTSDRNIIHVRATLWYHIDNPIDYVFNFESASNAVQNALDNALLYTAAHFKVDDTIYGDVAFQDAVEQRVRELADEEKLGIVIDPGQCQVRSIPPRQLKEAFDQIVIARENRQKTIDDAKNYANTNLLAASSTAFAITNKADSDRVTYVADMEASAHSFTSQLEEYQRNPALFRKLRLADMMAVTLTNAQRVEFLPTRADGKTRELRLMLNDAPPLQKTAASP